MNPKFCTFLIFFRINLKHVFLMFSFKIIPYVSFRLAPSNNNQEAMVLCTYYILSKYANIVK